MSGSDTVPEATAAAPRDLPRHADPGSIQVACAVWKITPIIKPIGPAEVDALGALDGRIVAASKWAAKDAQHARVAAVHAEYKAALDARKTGMGDAAAKRALRDAAREDFLDTFAAVVAGVRSTFLQDRPRNEVFFDTVRARGVVEDGVDGPDDPTKPDGPVNPT